MTAEIDWRLTKMNAVVGDELAKLDDAQIEKIQRRMASIVDKEFERLLGFPFPELPPISIKRMPPCDCGPIFHRAGCKYGGYVT